MRLSPYAYIAAPLHWMIPDEPRSSVIPIGLTFTPRKIKAGSTTDLRPSDVGFLLYGLLDRLSSLKSVFDLMSCLAHVFILGDD